MRDLGRLLRLSLTATAIADVAAGVVLGAGRWPGGAGPWLLIVASLGVYHGGMVLNDWADREHDARTRPERPLPSGRVPSGLALGLAVTLLLGGPLVALLVDRRPAVVLAVAALLAALYDLRGRGPWLGPLLLGFCRALNLTAGLAYGLALSPRPDAGTVAAMLVFPAGYGLYVFLVSRLGRLEDREDEVGARRVSPRALVLVAAALLLVPPVAAGLMADMDWLAARSLAQGPWSGLGVALVGAFGLARRAWTLSAWTPATIGATMGMALRRLLVYTSAVALVTDGLIAGGLILLGYPVSHALRKLFPPS